MGSPLRNYLPALKYGHRILPADIIGGGGLFSLGNIYYAMDPTSSFYTNFEKDYQVTYSDGTESVYSTIQAAVNAATSERGDTIIVGPKSKWKEEVYVVEKNRLRIIGTGYGTGDTGIRMNPTDATTHYAFTSKLSTAVSGAAFHILSQGVELTGFFLNGGGNYAGAYLGGGLNGGITGYDDETASGAWIHNNLFRGGSEGKIGLYMNGAKFGCVVEDNIFERCVTTCIEMDAGNASNEFCVLRNNVIGADDSGASYGIQLYGEENSSLGCTVASNMFVDRADTNVFTMALKNPTSSSGGLNVLNNWFCCANTLQLQTTDWVSGNYYGFDGSATEKSNSFIDEETGTELEAG